MVFDGLFETEYAPVVDIHLSQYSYIPGQQVTGQVSLQLSKSYRYSGITVEFTGTIETSLGGKTKSHSKMCYFYDSICLFKDESEEKLAVGEHIFPFNFALPHNLPDTLEIAATTKSQGRVKYWIQLRISNPSPFRANLVKELEVPVFTPYNGPPLPLSTSESTKVSSWYCFGSSGIISWTVKLDTTVWRGGEVVTLSVFVDTRESSRGVKGAYAKLTEHATITGEGISESVYGIVCVAETTERVAAKHTGLLTMEMQVPSIIQSSCNLSLLTCSYLLKVYIDIPNNVDPLIQVPITICRRKNTNESVATPTSTPSPVLSEYMAPVYSMSSPTDAPPAYEA